MDTQDAKHLMDNSLDEHKKDKAVTEPTRIRPSDRLVSFHLKQTAPIANLAGEWGRQVLDGPVDLYNRLKPRDVVDSIYCLSIVAMTNASMKFYNAATRSTQGEDIDRAYEGTARLMNLVRARESRRALLEDRNRREEVLEELVKRYGSPATPSRT